MKKFIFICACISLFVSGCCFNPDEKEVIKFSTWGSASEMAVLKPVINDFESENPGIKVEVLHIPQDYFQKLHLLFASKTEPDVLLINNQNIPVYSKFLCGLNEFVEKSDYFKNPIDSLSQDDVLYAIPRDCSGLIIYYNKDIFDKNGVKYPCENWSIEDLIRISQMLTNSLNWGISYEPSIYYAQPFMHYFGGGVHIGESVQSKKGVELYKSLAYVLHCTPMPSEVGSKTLAQMFLEGKLAMHISGRWLVPKYRTCARFNWDVVNFPQYAATCDSTGWAISKRSKHIESARKFVMYLSCRESIERFSESGLIVPARKDVAYSKSFFQGKYFIKSVMNSDITKVNLHYNRDVERLNDLYFNTGR